MQVSSVAATGRMGLVPGFVCEEMHVVRQVTREIDDVSARDRPSGLSPERRRAVVGWRRLRRPGSFEPNHANAVVNGSRRPAIRFIRLGSERHKKYPTSRCWLDAERMALDRYAVEFRDCLKLRPARPDMRGGLGQKPDRQGDDVLCESRTSRSVARRKRHGQRAERRLDQAVVPDLGARRSDGFLEPGEARSHRFLGPHAPRVASGRRVRAETAEVTSTVSRPAGPPPRRLQDERALRNRARKAGRPLPVGEHAGPGSRDRAVRA